LCQNNPLISRFSNGKFGKLKECFMATKLKVFSW
jgi:hypothetical protein